MLVKVEYLKVVDENNVPTGKREHRQIIHSKRLWHRTANIYFYRNLNNSVEILVHLRLKTKDLNPNWRPYVWDTRLKAGETIEETTIDEIKDEIGLTVSFIDLIDYGWEKYDDGKNRGFNRVFLYQLKGNINKLVFNDGEVQEVKWMKVDDIIKSVKEIPRKWVVKSKDLARILNYFINNFKL